MEHTKKEEEAYSVLFTSVDYNVNTLYMNIRFQNNLCFWNCNQFVSLI